MTKEFNNLEEIQKYYGENTNTYIFKENDEYIDVVVFNFDLDVEANIDSLDIKARNINVLDIDSIDIKARERILLIGQCALLIMISNVNLLKEE